MAWQNVYGSWKHDPAVPGDIIMGGGSGWNGFPGNPPGSPAPYGKGVSVTEISKDVYRFNLSLVGYAISAATGKYLASYYFGDRSTEYQWIIKVALSYDAVTDPKKAKYTQLFQENFKKKYYGGDPLYGYTNWHTKAYEGTTSNTFTATTKDCWIRIEIYGEPAVTPLYAYFKLASAIEDFRPFAIRKGNTFKSLDTAKGFLRIRKSGSWKEIPKMSYGDVGKVNKGTARIRKNGKWVGQGKIGS
ncbi:hypothetical protein P0E66_13960 [Enterococcus faecalis]|uniref:hypothetical protein n=1 Tax=Enterococcus faecalis TaxID=1351 RepID=UPI0019EF96EE|nr:hypothetical protein [Enterococcus faecalis]EGO8428651.1 hypothetical protein [Enterococcus faecalis]MDN3202231.1 hypothetical protein [Enterococcus faecalis]